MFRCNVIPRVFLVLNLLLPFAAAAADDADVNWIADSRGCKVANPFPQPGESIKWNGACRSGLADGAGVLEWFVDGKAADRFEGTLKDGWAEGKGTLTREGGRYAGEWKRSLQDGNGRYDSADGSWYEGEWKEGQPHGRGQYQTPDGRVISGTWTEGEYDGDIEYDPNRT
jgi:hypothetical protein